MPPRFVPPPGHTLRTSQRTPKPVTYADSVKYALPVKAWRYRYRPRSSPVPRSSLVPRYCEVPAAVSAASSAPTSPRGTEVCSLQLDDALHAFECSVNTMPTFTDPAAHGARRKPPCKYTSRLWTEQEDTALLCAVQDAGMQPWPCIAVLSGLQRSGKQCRERYCNTLDPNINFSAFTEAEDRILAHARVVGQCSWAAIARSLTGRTDGQVKNRFNVLLSHHLVAGLVNEGNQAVDSYVQRRRQESGERSVQRYFQTLDNKRLERETARLQKLVAPAPAPAAPPQQFSGNKPGFLFASTLPNWSERPSGMFRFTNWHVAARRPSALERPRKRRRSEVPAPQTE